MDPRKPLPRGRWPELVLTFLLLGGIQKIIFKAMWLRSWCEGSSRNTPKVRDVFKTSAAFGMAFQHQQHLNAGSRTYKRLTKELLRFAQELELIRRERRQSRRESRAGRLETREQQVGKTKSNRFLGSFHFKSLTILESVLISRFSLLPIPFGTLGMTQTAKWNRFLDR